MDCQVTPQLQESLPGPFKGATGKRLKHCFSTWNHGLLCAKLEGGSQMILDHLGMNGLRRDKFATLLKSKMPQQNKHAPTFPIATQLAVSICCLAFKHWGNYISFIFWKFSKSIAESSSTSFPPWGWPSQCRHLLQNLQPGAEDAKTGTRPGLSTRGDSSQPRNEAENSMEFILL